MVSALLTDMYQISMAYAYWKAGKHHDPAVFDLLFRKNPFGGEYTVFAGLEECVRFAANFKFKDADIKYLQSIMPSTCEVSILSPSSFHFASTHILYSINRVSECESYRQLLQQALTPLEAVCAFFITVLNNFIPLL